MSPAAVVVKKKKKSCEPNPPKIRLMSRKVTANLRAHSPLERVIDRNFCAPPPPPPLQPNPHPPPLCSGRGATAERRGQVSPPERRPARPHRGVRAAS